MQYELSICIPTYNRAPFLRKALESVVPQLSEDMEIVISDNASEDDTASVVQEYCRPGRAIRYHVQSRNEGPDRNYLKVIELARGRYCWFLGSDDALLPGAVRRIRNEMSAGPDVILCNRLVCNLQMEPLSECSWLSPDVGDAFFNLSDANVLSGYLDCCCSIGAVFAYLSCLVFRRDKWMAVPYDESFTGSAYAHTYKMLGFLRQGCRLRYVKDALVLCCLYQSSHVGRSYVRRVLLDVDGYLRFADVFIGDQPQLREKFLRVLHREYAGFSDLVQVLKYRVLSERKDWVEFRGKVEAIWGRNPMFDRSERIPLPPWLLRAVLSSVHKYGWDRWYHRAFRRRQIRVTSAPGPGEGSPAA